HFAGTDPLAAKLHIGNFVRQESQLRADAPEQCDVPFAIVSESEAAAQVNFFCMQSILYDVTQKIFGSDLRKRFIEANDDCLLDSEHAKAFNFLIESLQERRRRLG